MQFVFTLRIIIMIGMLIVMGMQGEVSSQPQGVGLLGLTPIGEPPTPTAEPTATNTPTVEPTATNTPTPTNTATPEPMATNTPTSEPTATNTPTARLEPTATNTPTSEPTATNTATSEPTATNIPTVGPTATNTPTSEPTATSSPTAEPTNPPTQEPTATNVLTATPQPTAANTPTVEPTNTPTPLPTATPSPSPIAVLPVGFGADPTLSKQVNAQESRLGDVIEFTLTVRNNGDMPTEDVVVSDPVPEWLDVLEVYTTHGQTDTNGNMVTVSVGTVTPDDMIIIRIETRVVARALAPNNRNVAYLTSSNADNDHSNNSDVAVITILASSADEPTPTMVPTQETMVPAPEYPTSESPRSSLAPSEGADSDTSPGGQMPTPTPTSVIADAAETPRILPGTGVSYTPALFLMAALGLLVCILGYSLTTSRLIDVRRSDVQDGGVR